MARWLEKGNTVHFTSNYPITRADVWDPACSSSSPFIATTVICCSRSCRWLSCPFEAEARGRSRVIFLLESIFSSFSNDVVVRASAPYAGCRVTSNSCCFLVSLIKIYVSCPKMKGLAGNSFWSGTTIQTRRAVRGSGTEDAAGMKTDLIHRKTVKRFALMVSDRSLVFVELADRMRVPGQCMMHLLKICEWLWCLWIRR